MTFQDTYGSGKISCSVGQDTLKLGQSNSIATPGMLFGMATSEASVFNNFFADGILGLAFPGVAGVIDPSTNQPFWVLGKIFLAHPALSPYFSVYMGRALPHGKVDASGSELIFGGYDTALINDQTTVPGTPFVFTDVHPIQRATATTTDNPSGNPSGKPSATDGPGFYAWWLVSVHPAVVNAAGELIVDLCDDLSGCFAMIDTGTSLIAVPKSKFNTLLVGLGKGATVANGGTTPLQCTTDSSGKQATCDLCTYDGHDSTTLYSCYPSLAIDVPLSSGVHTDRTDGTVSTSYQMLLPASDYFTLTVNENGKPLYLNLQMFASPSMLSQPTWILGDTFLRRYITRYDIEQTGEAMNGNDNTIPTVGFATTSGKLALFCLF